MPILVEGPPAQENQVNNQAAIENQAVLPPGGNQGQPSPNPIVPDASAEPRAKRKLDFDNEDGDSNPVIGAAIIGENQGQPSLDIIAPEAFVNMNEDFNPDIGEVPLDHAPNIAGHNQSPSDDDYLEDENDDNATAAGFGIMRRGGNFQPLPSIVTTKPGGDFSFLLFYKSLCNMIRGVFSSIDSLDVSIFMNVF